ncbi:MAG TPA: hypothetical protein PKN48_07545 [Bacteroidales bacterium]|nr:hypothetical protein [Bacteroidales bacterium]
MNSLYTLSGTICNQRKALFPIAFYIILLLFFCPAFGYAQSDTVMVKYTRDFKFNDGIYQTFKEFKDNKPSLPVFEVVKDNLYGEEGSMKLKYPCPDSIGSKKTCVIDECFGYSKNGILYMYQGYSGYYYRMFLVGALSHYIAFSKNRMGDMYFSTEPIAYVGSSNDYSEFLLDFETGETFHFNYKDFCDFLKIHDEELYQELQKTKQKRKMIHHFLLKYNEKHPVYFPVYK